MPQEQYFPTQSKVDTVLDYLSGKITLEKAAAENDVEAETISNWVSSAKEGMHDALKGEFTPADGDDIFISYSLNDSKVFAERLYHTLKKMGYRVWFYTHDDRLGFDHHVGLNRAIRESGLFIAIISEMYCRDSNWGYKEFCMALREDKVKRELHKVEYLENFEFTTAVNEDSCKREHLDGNPYLLPILYGYLSHTDGRLKEKNRTIADYVEKFGYISCNMNYGDEEFNVLVESIVTKTGLVMDCFVQTDNYDIEISRFPVTNLEYKRFINSGGYSTNGVERWWSEDGKEFWYAYAKRNEHKYIYGDKRTEDTSITSNQCAKYSLYNRFNQPVTGICYFEAQAYCKWLSEQGDNINNYLIRMPTQQEWMGALTNYGLTKFPWGDSEPQVSQVNLIEERSEKGEQGTLEAYAYINIPNIFGRYPDGANKYGCQDLVGNVWEWVNDFELPSPTTDPGNIGKILGRCCFDPPSRVNYPPIDYRYPGYRHQVIGFRIAREKINNSM